MCLFYIICSQGTPTLQGPLKVHFSFELLTIDVISEPRIKKIDLCEINVPKQFCYSLIRKNGPLISRGRFCEPLLSKIRSLKKPDFRSCAIFLRKTKDGSVKLHERIFEAFGPLWKLIKRSFLLKTLK